MPNALSVRRETLHERMAKAVYPADGFKTDLDSAARLVILIHGFNNSEIRAREEFAAFRDRVRHDIPREQLWEFHWPGDHPKKLVSLRTYGVRVERAPEVGERLACFLAKRPPRQSVCIVAHSLGCRVALEAVKRIRAMQYGGARLEHVFLMAAAVPVPQCRDLPDRWFPEPLKDCSEHVFHSRRDLVLWLGFERGQDDVDLSERGPAVGRDGEPSDRWTEPVVKTRLGHGDYWGSKRVAGEIVRRLGGMGVKELAESYVPENPLASDTRELGENEIPEWPRATRSAY